MVRLYNDVHDLRFVQEQAGHANLKTTAMYSKIRWEHKQKDEKIRDNDFAALSSVDDFPQTTKKITTCQACGRSIFNDEGTKIDSGQILCCECIKYFHSNMNSRKQKTKQ